jgi:LTXXQ motif family protein
MKLPNLSRLARTAIIGAGLGFAGRGVERPPPILPAVDPQSTLPCAFLDARVAGMPTFGRDALGISQDQEGAWSRFAAAFRAGAEPIRKICAADHVPLPTASVPDWLAQAEKRAAERLETLQRIRPAVIDLYGALTLEVRQRAGQLAAPAPL